LIARAGTTGSLISQKKGLVGVPRTARTPEAEEMVLDAFLQEMLQNTRRSLIRRANLCIEMHGGHFEQLL
jgi:hypothetical protein